MKPFFKILLFWGVSWLLFSCEEEIAIELAPGEEQLIVQGHIEPEAPPFVILTRSKPVFSISEQDDFSSSLVHQAQVSVQVDGRVYPLQEVTISSLPAAQQQTIREQFGFTTPEISNKVSVYTSTELKGETRKIYLLQILAEGKTLTATSSIPGPTPVDSLWFRPHPNPKNDSLVTLWYRYQDPDTLGNNVRFFTSRNSEPFYPGYQASVLTDEFVNNRTIEFPLERGYPKSAKVDLETYSYFKKGDTVRLKWTTIDYAHYQFWFTLEADRASNGNPLGFPTTVRSNIKGGLGIWGGYGVSRHTVVSY
ncbi:DUF4249 family protein [Adhaeribacter swui]|uniref:DUF4249 family protein n=1 Tax=Adhaeribacter swui TaxID=2086471 RepID=A0A7G7GDF3_9BACT|nr:DUF4249 family protein [Adhaeribacter swui]QNF35187.1 DUF4249 family protein [Adhaeribacter swui]